MAVVSARLRSKDANRGFTMILGVSLLIHAAIIGGRLYMEYAKPARVVIDSVPVQLVRLGKPRDPNLLPRLQRPAAPPPADDGIALDTGNDKKPKSRKDERRRRRKDPELSDAARRLLETAPDRDLDAALSKLDEPEGSPDGSIYGTTSDAANAAAGYYAKVSEAIHKAYQLPATIPESQRRFLSAEVALYIERDGTLSKYEILKSHPNVAFQRALERVLKTLKLPPPPPDVAENVRTAGLGVRFVPSQ